MNKSLIFRSVKEIKEKNTKKTEWSEKEKKQKKNEEKLYTKRRVSKWGKKNNGSPLNNKLLQLIKLLALINSRFAYI